MKVAVTGAFGNVGRSTVEQLLKQGHRVRGFDLKTRANQKVARKLGDRVDVVWGDLRRYGDVAALVRGQDVVIHLAFIIPSLSATGFEPEDHPDWAREINVGGTRNLIVAMEAQPRPPRLVFASSYHIYGRTQHLPPPRTAAELPQPIEHYAFHKVEAEQMICASRLEWVILRLAAALPIHIKLDPGMFDVPLDNRMEYIHTRDAGLALANSAYSQDVWGKVLLIGGGPRCQYRYREITEKVLEGIGVGMLPDEAFATTPFPTDWLDSAESQRLLQYQCHTLDDYVEDMQRLLGIKRQLIRVFRPLVRYMLLSQSPHLHPDKPGWVASLTDWIKASKSPSGLEMR
jgi:nucleoside-diphosphate-sugar epimerase